MRRQFRNPRLYQGGFLGFIKDLAGPIVSGLFGFGGQKKANDANLEIAKMQMDFNREEAEKSRTFNSAEAVLARQFLDEQAGISRNFNRDEAQTNRAFQERMAGSTYQRAVADLAAAGLNPMLAYSQGGAPAPGGNMATSSPTGTSTASGGAASAGSMPRMANTAAAALSSAQAVENITNLRKTGANIDADTALKNAQAIKEQSSAANLDASTKDILYKLQEKVPEEIRTLRAQQGSHFWRQMVDAAQTEVLKVEKLLRHEQIGLTEAQTKYSNIRTLLANLAEPQARNAANAQDSWWMRNVSPYLPDALKSSSVINHFRD